MEDVLWLLDDEVSLNVKLSAHQLKNKQLMQLQMRVQWTGNDSQILSIDKTAA